MSVRRWGVHRSPRSRRRSGTVDQSGVAGAWWPALGPRSPTIDYSPAPSIWVRSGRIASVPRRNIVPTTMLNTPATTPIPR